MKQVSGVAVLGRARECKADFGILHWNDLDLVVRSDDARSDRWQIVLLDPMYWNRTISSYTIKRN